MENGIALLIVALNIFGAFFFAGMDYKVVGIVLSALSLISSVFLADYTWMHVFAKIVIKSNNIDLYFNKGNANRILISVAFLALAIKIGVLIHIGFMFAATVILAFAILLASGFFFEGYSSGMTITGVFNISKIILKIYSFVESIQKWLDKLFELIIKGEYKILGIKVKGEGEE